MKVITTGSTHRIYPDDLKTSDELKVGVYQVNFSPQTGFSLSDAPALEAGEEKIYGPHQSRVDRILNAYAHMDRSMGVILSGKKGMGKSLAMRLLAEQSNLPVIVVDTGYPGIINFIDSIEQEVLVFLDEFEKTFPERSDERVSQEDMLSLFDGISQQKRLYVVSVNKTAMLSEFLLNRPGRFHYHFKFDGLDPEEISEYLKDNVPGISDETLRRANSIASYASMNFDILRALAFELNLGEELDEAIDGLNVTIDKGLHFDVIIKTRNLGDFTTWGSVSMTNILSGRLGNNLRSVAGHEVYGCDIRFEPTDLVPLPLGGYSLNKFDVRDFDIELRDADDSENMPEEVVSIEFKPEVGTSHTLKDLV